jgi:outer membrane protein assembly factor BamE (lipoprotein component of BamABCDE complex)
MSRPHGPLAFLACLPMAALGCSSYHYMRDASPELHSARQEYVVNNPGNHFNDDIADGRVRKGMSRLQVRSTWGDPDQVTPRAANSEVWSYQELEASRGASVYNLRFDGELLTEVDIDRAGAMPGTNTAEDPKQEDKTLVPATTTSTSKKPGVDWN